jgi:multidrug efflux pump subunit AcrA (membrane-fusion protein)
MKRLLVFGCAALALGTAGAYWGRGFLTARTAPAAAPTFVVPELRTIAATVSASGVVRLRVGAEVRVGAQVSGIVRTLNVTVGSHIRRGDIIAEIDSRGLDARLAQARAQIAVNEQEVRRAEVELGRARQLGERQLVPRQQIEDLALALDDAKAKLAKAQRDAEVVETDRSYAVIRAPIAGTVASVSTQEGETVAASFTAPTFVTISVSDARVRGACRAHRAEGHDRLGRRQLRGDGRHRFPSRRLEAGHDGQHLHSDRRAPGTRRPERRRPT